MWMLGKLGRVFPEFSRKTGFVGVLPTLPFEDCRMVSPFPTGKCDDEARLFQRDLSSTVLNSIRTTCRGRISSSRG